VLQYVFTPAGVTLGEDGDTPRDTPRSQMPRTSPLQTPVDSSSVAPPPDATEPTPSIRNLRLDGND
jgi:hypothetical protein